MRLEGLRKSDEEGEIWKGREWEAEDRCRVPSSPEKKTTTDAGDLERET